MTQHELVKCPHCESTSIFIHQEDDLCLCGECGEAWERATKAQAVPKVGDRIAQAMLIPVPVVTLEEVTELSDSERGDGGFGSSGR